MGSGIVDGDDIADLDLRDLPVDGELVVVFTEAAGHVGGKFQQSVLFSKHGYVMICSVHGRAHQVRHRGIETDEGLVGLLAVQHGADKPSIGAGDDPAALHDDAELSKPRGGNPLFKVPFYSRRDILQVYRLLPGAVGDADTTSEVDELQLYSQGLFELHRQVEEQRRRFDEIVGIQLVGGNHGVQREAFRAHLTRPAVAVYKLLSGKAVLGLGRLADDVVAALELTRVVAEADQLRHAGMLLQILQVRDVVKIDHRPQLPGLDVLLCRGIVGGEHDILAPYPRHLGKEELRQGRTVGPHALLLENPDNPGVRQGLDGEVILEPSGNPVEGLVEPPGVGPDGSLVVDMKRGRVLPGNLHYLFSGKGQGLGVHAKTVLKGCREGLCYR